MLFQNVQPAPIPRYHIYLPPCIVHTSYVNIKELHEWGIQWQGRYREREQAKMPWPSSESVKYWQVLISTIHLEGCHLQLYQKAHLGVQKQKKSTISSKGKVNTRRGSSRTIISSGGPWSTGRICGAARPFIKALLNSNRHKPLTPHKYSWSNIVWPKHWQLFWDNVHL